MTRPGAGDVDYPQASYDSDPEDEPNFCAACGDFAPAGGLLCESCRERNDRHNERGTK